MFSHNDAILQQIFDEFAEAVETFDYTQLRSVEYKEGEELSGRATAAIVERLIKIFSNAAPLLTLQLNEEQFNRLGEILIAFKNGVQKVEYDLFIKMYPPELAQTYLGDLQKSAEWVERFHFIIEKHLDEKDMQGISIRDYGTLVRKHMQGLYRMQEKTFAKTWGQGMEAIDIPQVHKRISDASKEASSSSQASAAVTPVVSNSASSRDIPPTRSSFGLSSRSLITTQRYPAQGSQKEASSSDQGAAAESLVLLNGASSIDSFSLLSALSRSLYSSSSHPISRKKTPTPPPDASSLSLLFPSLAPPSFPIEKNEDEENISRKKQRT